MLRNIKLRAKFIKLCASFLVFILENIHHEECMMNTILCDALQDMVLIFYIAHRKALQVTASVYPLSSVTLLFQ